MTSFRYKVPTSGFWVLEVEAKDETEAKLLIQNGHYDKVVDVVNNLDNNTDNWEST